MDVARQPDDLHGEVALPAQQAKARPFRLRQEDLGNGVTVGEGDQRFGFVLFVQDAGFNLQFADEIEMFLDSFVRLRADGDGEAVGPQVVRNALAAADEGGRRGAVGNVGLC